MCAGWVCVFVGGCGFAQFPDEKNGEWVGYLSREGSKVLDFKGGPFKGELQKKGLSKK